MRRPILVFSILVIVVALAGCSADEDAPSATFVTPSAGAATPTATTPSTLTYDEAAQRFLDIVRPYNEALERLVDAVNGGEPLETQRARAAETAEELENEISELRAAHWPAEVSEHVDELIAASERALEHWHQAAEAQTRDDLVEAVLAAAEHDGTEAAGAIRELLDLDPYDPSDY